MLLSLGSHILIFDRNMPDIDNLMQEWPAEFEDLLKEVRINKNVHYM